MTSPTGRDDTRGVPITQTQWPFPDKVRIKGRFMDLVPLHTDHVADLWDVARAAPDSFEYLRYGPFAARNDLRNLVKDLSGRADQPFWAVVMPNGQAKGWVSICDVSTSDGAFEIGSIWFAPVLQGSRAAREAVFQLMTLGMDTLGYERLVWRCQAENEKSVQAALKMGFTREGTWRNAAVVRGWQRDVAWFSILKDEWPTCKQAFELWLDHMNFDAAGQQKKSLKDMRQAG